MKNKVRCAIANRWGLPMEGLLMNKKDFQMNNEAQKEMVLMMLRQLKAQGRKSMQSMQEDSMKKLKKTMEYLDLMEQCLNIKISEVQTFKTQESSKNKEYLQKEKRILRKTNKKQSLKWIKQWEMNILRHAFEDPRKSLKDQWAAFKEIKNWIKDLKQILKDN